MRTNLRGWYARSRWATLQYVNSPSDIWSFNFGTAPAGRQGRVHALSHMKPVDEDTAMPGAPFHCVNHRPGSEDDGSVLRSTILLPTSLTTPLHSTLGERIVSDDSKKQQRTSFDVQRQQHMNEMGDLCAVTFYLYGKRRQ